MKRKSVQIILTIMLWMFCLGLTACGKSFRQETDGSHSTEAAVNDQTKASSDAGETAAAADSSVEVSDIPEAETADTAVQTEEDTSSAEETTAQSGKENETNMTESHPAEDLCSFQIAWVSSGIYLEVAQKAFPGEDFDERIRKEPTFKLPHPVFCLSDPTELKQFGEMFDHSSGNSRRRSLKELTESFSDEDLSEKVIYAIYCENGGGPLYEEDYTVSMSFEEDVLRFRVGMTGYTRVVADAVMANWLLIPVSKALAERAGSFEAILVY